MPIRPLKFIAALVFTFLCVSASLAQGDTPTTKRSIHIQVSQSKTDAENLAWTAYGVSLAHYLETTGLAKTVPEGEYAPSFEGEVAAREKLLRIWRELTEKQNLSFAYMDILQKVEAAGFLRQYIWRYHHRPNWKDQEAPSRQDEFASWAAYNLVGHVPMTGAKLVISTKK
jgi:hypothetical protein